MRKVSRAIISCKVTGDSIVAVSGVIFLNKNIDGLVTYFVIYLYILLTVYLIFYSGF